RRHTRFSRDWSSDVCSSDLDTGGKNKLYYGIDGEWTAHTVYVSDSNGKLTVDGGSRTIQNDAGKDETINLKGKQWVYGGLRMGRSEERRVGKEWRCGWRRWE